MVVTLKYKFVFIIHGIDCLLFQISLHKTKLLPHSKNLHSNCESISTFVQQFNIQQYFFLTIPII